MLCNGLLPTALMHQSVDDSTRGKYAATLRALYEFCDGEEVTSKRIEDFVADRSDNEVGKSLQQYLSHLNYFAGLGYLPQVHTERTARLVKGACRLDSTDPKSTKLNMSPQVVLHIRGQAARTTTSPDHVGVATQCALGLRGGEMARAHPWHVALETSRFIIPPSKHDPYWRALPIPPEDSWLFEKLQECLPFPPGSYPRKFRWVCKQYGSNATPHDARRFFTTSQHCLATPMATISKYLRHRSEKPTAIYIRTMPRDWSDLIRKKFHRVPNF